MEVKLYQVSYSSYDSSDDYLYNSLSSPTTSLDEALAEYEQEKVIAKNSAVEEIEDEGQSYDDLDITEVDNTFTLNYNRNGADVKTEIALYVWEIEV